MTTTIIYPAARFRAGNVLIAVDSGKYGDKITLSRHGIGAGDKQALVASLRQCADEIEEEELIEFSDEELDRALITDFLDSARAFHERFERFEFLGDVGQLPDVYCGFRRPQYYIPATYHPADGG
jgi:hypothetical protein